MKQSVCRTIPRCPRGALSLLLTIFLLLTTGCREDMEITMDAPLAKPIIYCILNPNDSVQYLRIGRIFLGSQGALTTARNPDSIYFKQVNAWLERIESDSIKELLTFQANDNQIKDTGLFSNTKGGLFQLSRNSTLRPLPKPNLKRR